MFGGVDQLGTSHTNLRHSAHFGGPLVAARPTVRCGRGRTERVAGAHGDWAHGDSSTSGPGEGARAVERRKMFGWMALSDVESVLIITQKDIISCPLRKWDSSSLQALRILRS